MPGKARLESSGKRKKKRDRITEKTPVQNIDKTGKFHNNNIDSKGKRQTYQFCHHYRRSLSGKNLSSRTRVVI